MLKNLLVPLGVFTLAVPASAAVSSRTLAKELTAAIKSADHVLATAPAKWGAWGFPYVRLPRDAKLELRAPGRFVGSGLRRATAILGGAKADLARALRSRRKVDGAVAATFLARYAWFRVAYACQVHQIDVAYPRRRFRRLISEALALDPKSPQALLMRAWLFAQVHSHPWVRPLAHQPPGSMETGVRFSARARTRAAAMVARVLQTEPKNFAAWELLSLVEPNWDAKVYFSLLRYAAHADMFYFGFDRRAVGQILRVARLELVGRPRYYEEYYGHPPPERKPTKAAPPTRPGH